MIKIHLFFSAFFIIFGSFLLSVSANTGDEEKEIELENIRGKIKDLEKRIEGAKNETDLLAKELRDNELATANKLTQLHDTELRIRQKNAELEELRFEQEELGQSLTSERNALVNQIRAAYQMGRNDYLKLLLNQEDPAHVGRALAYYDYHNRIRSERILQVQQTLDEITAIQQSIEQETTKLQTLRVEYEAELSDFYRYRTFRKEIISRLESFIDEQGIELHTLQENEKELSKLFSGLKEQKTVAIEMFEDMPPFNTLRGELPWPVKGKLLKRFGHLKKGGNLKWQGVLIDAESGTQVSAVGTGKVVFADWFRNLGLLIILDHGDGYMTLYGHNQNLLKNTGDWVLAGETIATVGDSGGQSDSALYFEIRKGAEPMNPSKWCRG